MPKHKETQKLKEFRNWLSNIYWLSIRFQKEIIKNVKTLMDESFELGFKSSLKQEEIGSKTNLKHYVAVLYIVSKQLQISMRDITLTSDLIELGADSLDLIELILEFEEEYALTIPDDESEKIKTIEDILLYLNLQNVEVITPKG